MPRRVELDTMRGFASNTGTRSHIIATTMATAVAVCPLGLFPERQIFTLPTTLATVVLPATWDFAPTGNPVGHGFVSLPLRTTTAWNLDVGKTLHHAVLLRTVMSGEPIRFCFVSFGRAVGFVTLRSASTCPPPPPTTMFELMLVIQCAVDTSHWPCAPFQITDVLTANRARRKRPWIRWVDEW
jgi:hypothetical protein